MSFPKTKFMVIGNIVVDEEKCHLFVGDCLIKWVEQFPYLGSSISDNGRISREVDRHVANASKALGAL